MRLSSIQAIVNILGAASSCAWLLGLGSVLALALLVLQGPSSAWAADPMGPSVTVETSRRAYLLGDVVEITVTNKRDVPIFLPGCESFQLERFEGEAYRSMPLEPCGREGLALPVPPGTKTFEYRPGREQLKQLLRVTVVFGWGCTDARALSSARCSDFATVRSSSFRISSRPE
ncbi:MAG TPA: hypothetical protein DIU15_01470 [Deltaproteobacteria bacterium]|nr:hypothetical protein [Deltaproteobacteria bacterium]HCP44694.1 hypothetical protein [Deltaproteobacteria bacterium]